MLPPGSATPRDRPGENLVIGKMKLGWLRGVDLNHRPLGYE